MKALGSSSKPPTSWITRRHTLYAESSVIVLLKYPPRNNDAVCLLPSTVFKSLDTILDNFSISSLLKVFKVSLGSLFEYGLSVICLSEVSTH